MKYNKLIAEFMGCTHPHNDITDATLYEVSHGIFELNELRYDMAWDWLIPVAQKLVHDYSVMDEQDEQDLQQSILNNRIGVVYQIVVELIKLYNKKD